MEAQKQPQYSSALGRAARMVMLPRELSQPWPGGSSLRNVGVWGSARPADVGNWHLGQLPSPAPAPCPGAYTSSGDCLSSKTPYLYGQPRHQCLVWKEQGILRRKHSLTLIFQGSTFLNCLNANTWPTSQAWWLCPPKLNLFTLHIGKYIVKTIRIKSFSHDLISLLSLSYWILSLVGSNN